MKIRAGTTDSAHFPGTERANPRPATRPAGALLPIRRILVPVDFSDCSNKALDYALQFAAQFQATVILLHVVEPGLASEGFSSLGAGLEDTNERLLESGRESLAELYRQRIREGVPVESLVRMGRAPSEIADTAKALAADVIVMGTRGDDDLKHAILGNTTERVVRQAPCPVLTVPPSRGQTARRP